MSRITELFEELAESVSGFGEELTRAGTAGRKYQDIENERLVEGLYKNDPLLLSTLTGLGTAPVAVPAWLSRFAAGPLNKMYGAVGGDMVDQAIRNIGSKLPGTNPRGTGEFMIPRNPRHRAREVDKVIWNKDRYPKQSDRIANRRPANAEEINMIKAQQEGIMNTSSGARVGTDAAGRAPMPKPKTPAPTNRGPRGNTNIDAPVQRNLDLSDLKPTGIQNTTQARRMNPKMRESLTTRRDNIQQDIFKMEGQNSLNEVVDMQKLFRLQDELKALNKTLLD